MDAPSNPSAPNGHVNGLPSAFTAPTACKRCGTAIIEGADRCPLCRSFVSRNQAARKIGLRAMIQPANIRMTANELVDGIVRDLGGPSDLTALTRAYVRKIADIEITLHLLAADLVKHGLLTPGGRPRETYDKYLAGVAMWDRLAQRIGLERRTKRAPSLADLLANYEPAAVPPEPASTPAPAARPASADVETGAAPACASGDSRQPDDDEEATC